VVPRMSQNGMSGMPPPKGPYKGLKPFSEEDAVIFFGRIRERETIVTNLMASRLTVLYGPPGVGKSSILNAGVAHHLRQLARQYLTDEGTPEFNVVVFSSWHYNPVAELIGCVKNALVKDLKLQLPDAAPGTLNEALQNLTDDLDIDLFIILDQFEEFFVYHPHEEPGDSFVSEFARAIKNSSLRVNFLISIREDWIAKLDCFKDDLPSLFDNYLRLKHLSMEEARTAIEAPVREYGKLVKGHEDEFGIEPSLVKVVLTDLAKLNNPLGLLSDEVSTAPTKTDKTPVEGLIQASYLQLLMTQLWERERRSGSLFLHLKTLESVGGVKGVVSFHVGALLDKLSQQEQDIAARVLRYLVTPQGTKYAQPVPFLRLSIDPWQREQLLPLLEKLSGDDFFLLRVVNISDAKEDSYEISHDLLSPAILEWRIKYDLQQEQKEKRESARKRLVPVIFVLTIGIIALLAVLSFFLRKETTLIANSREVAASANVVLPQDRRLSLLLASAAYDIYPTKEAEEALRNSSNGPQESFRLLTLMHQDMSDPQVASATFSPDGHKVATVDNIGNVRIWEVPKIPDKAPGSQPIIILNSKDVLKVAFSPDGQSIVTAGADKIARVRDLNTGKTIELIGHAKPVLSAAFSSDGKLIVTTSEDQTARIWSAQGEALVTLGGHTDAVTSAAFSPDGKSLVTTSPDKTARLWKEPWKEPDKKSILTLNGHSRQVNSAAFSRDGTKVVTAGSDNRALVWSTMTGQKLVELTGHVDAVNSAKFSLDGKLILTASNDHTAQVWDSNTGDNIRELRAHTGLVFDAIFDTGSKNVFTVSDDKTVWNFAPASFAPFDEILQRARDEIKKGDLKLTPAERQKYLHEPVPASLSNSAG
jgi:WD40 repeat protein